MDSNKDERAYAQWVIIILHNVGSSPFKIANLGLSWGKLYADGNKDKEVYPSDYNGKTVGPDEKIQINSCGRENASSGTEGSFDIVDPNDGNKTIRHFYWECPWGSKRNTWTPSGSNTKWMVEWSGQNLDSGALGTITVDVLRKGN
uniref:Aegerolysin Aa-Pri1 n=1 Tax=Cyclocybe aegerita TaxID=1973307 RepID=AAPR1_CYCAE|nr:RecName: Full=Aegerolysin Aa-Pri1; Flags: Precursor [Cyclocybe aegerita]AAC02265.1 Aa-Pri1 [Cyclocybe aegerita]